MSRYDHATVIFLTRHGLQKVRALVPRTREDRASGLKSVRFLPPDSGMLFEFDVAQQPVLTMQGVSIPLDMVFIGPLGVMGSMSVRDIRHASPGEPQIFGPRGTRYVLELPAGYVRQQGVVPSQLVRVKLR